MRRDRARRPWAVARRLAPLFGLVVLSCVGKAPVDQGDSAAQNDADTSEVSRGPWEDVQASGAAACGRRAGAWECWGEPDVAGMPAELAAYPSVSLGSRAGCARNDDGALACWGRGPVVNFGPPEGTGYLDVDVGVDVACAVSAEGAPVCWGDDDSFEEGIVPPPEGLELVTVEAGAMLECGLDATGTIYCWGEPENGGEPLLDPPTGEGWIDLAVGASSGCAATSTERVVCWGYAVIDVLDPPGSLRASQLDANFVDGLCALTPDEDVACWGNFGAGEVDGAPPVLPDATYSGMALGSQFLCGLTTDGEIHCAGDNSEGQLDVPE